MIAYLERTTYILLENAGFYGDSGLRSFVHTGDRDWVRDNYVSRKKEKTSAHRKEHQGRS
jgi:hypothetical protein